MATASETTTTFATEVITTTTLPITTTAFPMTTTSEAIVPRIYAGITEDNGASMLYIILGSLLGCVVLCIILIICALRKNRTLVSVQTNNTLKLDVQSPSDDDMIGGDNDTDVMDDIRL
eukprot:222431_1